MILHSDPSQSLFRQEMTLPALPQSGSYIRALHFTLLPLLHPALRRSAPSPSPFPPLAQSLLGTPSRSTRHPHHVAARPFPQSLRGSANPALPAPPFRAPPNAALTPPSGPPPSCICCTGVVIPTARTRPVIAHGLRTPASLLEPPVTNALLRAHLPRASGPYRRTVRPSARLPFSVRRARYSSRSDPYHLNRPRRDQSAPYLSSPASSHPRTLSLDVSRSRKQHTDISPFALTLFSASSILIVVSSRTLV
ncbi:hypothetical protein DFH09DRAFT_1327896 [Mycena vulgaris]|nr:hypothetical protein DFH09DRAFT_1327896 [Mycena vulgaris]